MSLTDTQKISSAFKKLLGVAETSTTRDYFEEPFKGGLVVTPDMIWAEAAAIPTPAPTIATSLGTLGGDAVTYGDLGIVRRIVSLSLKPVPGAPKSFYHAQLKDTIPFNFTSDGTYGYRLFNSVGTAIAFGVQDWLVDPVSGVLTFYGSNLASIGVSAAQPPQLSFFRYIGLKGIQSGGGGQSLPVTDATVMLTKTGDVTTEAKFTVGGQTGVVSNYILPAVTGNSGTILVQENLSAALAASSAVVDAGQFAPTVSFGVASDSQWANYAGPSGVGGVLDALSLQAQDFILTVGDMAPLLANQSSPGFNPLARAKFPTLPLIYAVGNHDFDIQLTGEALMANLTWLQNNPWWLASGINLTKVSGIQEGPKAVGAAHSTTFSFDIGNAHIVVLNWYYDGQTDSWSIPTSPANPGSFAQGPFTVAYDWSYYGGGAFTAPWTDLGGLVHPTRGAVTSLQTWLDNDLQNSTQPVKLVVGHLPAYVFPDMETGGVADLGHCLDLTPTQRDAFWLLLKNRGVKAYICGHTHKCSVEVINGLAQINLGHARADAEVAAPSTFGHIDVYADASLRVEIYRKSEAGTAFAYRLAGVTTL